MKVPFLQFSLQWQPRGKPVDKDVFPTLGKAATLVEIPRLVATRIRSAGSGMLTSDMTVCNCEKQARLIFFGDSWLGHNTQFIDGGKDGLPSSLKDTRQVLYFYPPKVCTRCKTEKP